MLLVKELNSLLGSLEGPTIASKLTAGGATNVVDISILNIRNETAAKLRRCFIVPGNHL